MDRGRFTLVKWYMDCVTEDGEVAVLYCVDLHWGRIHARYSSALTAGERPPESHASMAGYRVSASEGEIAVEAPRLKAEGNWRADAPPVRQMVYQSDAGEVEWNCLQPRSLVQLRIGERAWNGLGYAECLTVTVPPWKLPMRQLRWGRFVSPENSLAWVDWQGGHSTSFAVHNGRTVETLAVSDAEVAVPGATLTMEEPLPLRTGRLASTVLPGLSALGGLLPRSLFNIEEHKWRSRGRLAAQEQSSRGWVIHEVVDWNV
ncbi:MAG: hypothetical protein WCE75_17290 [Terracidiphilus sp.]